MRENKNNCKSESFQNLEEVEKFLEKYNLSKPTQKKRTRTVLKKTGKFD